MPPPIKPRENYFAEINQLLYLARVTAVDDKLTESQHTEVKERINGLIAILTVRSVPDASKTGKLAKRKTGT